MPQKNRYFPYLENTYYHIYNRGVNKEPVFLDRTDYRVFRKVVREKLCEMEREALIDVFSLMDNHFHFRFFQKNARNITELMRTVMIRYTMYFRKRYDRTGQLFAGSYRAVALPTPEDQERIKKYILNNPIEAGLLNWEHVGTRI